MSKPIPTQRKSGFSVMEVLIALVVLGIFATIYAQTTQLSQKNTGKATDWQLEGTVIEKTIESVRTGYSLHQLQNVDSSWIDSTGRFKVSVSMKGGTPPASVCNGFSPEQLAQVSLVARRDGFDDSLSITTYLWVN
ncbi:MAG: hypothetical protein RL173_1269 [Fibrobacterota bacterium]|jgi:prepilin-type N-terminal cleavage/methylation domain-containing protein